MSIKFFIISLFGLIFYSLFRALYDFIHGQSSARFLLWRISGSCFLFIGLNIAAYLGFFLPHAGPG